MITKKIESYFIYYPLKTQIYVCCQVKICFICSKPLKIDKLSIVDSDIK